MLEINDTSEIFRLNILKSQKLSIILLGFIGLAPNAHYLNPYIFFKHIAKFNNYAFANRPRTGPDFFPNANLHLKNVLGYDGKHPILQITSEEESWGLKSGLWDARSNFWFFSAILSVISFLSATITFCFVCIWYGCLFKSATINFLPVDMLKFKDWLRRRSDSFGHSSTDSSTICTICCARILGRPEWLKRSEDLLLRLTAVPYVLNLLTQSWMSDLWSSLSISKNVWNFSEIFLTEPHL